MKLILITILSLVIIFRAGASPAQDFNKGMAAAQAGDYVTALKEWRPLAEQGLMKAQSNIGLLYENSLGVVQNFSEATKWYRLAAVRGDANAQYGLGSIYGGG